MKFQTRAFGEVDIPDDRLIQFPGGIVGFPELEYFAMLHNEDKKGGIHYLQSVAEAGFAMPVIDPLLVKQDYNPQIEDELLKPLGELNEEDCLVVVTVNVPKDITQMSVNLRGPIVINAATRKATQVIVEGDEYPLKYPIYDILKKNAENKKEGE